MSEGIAGGSLFAIPYVWNQGNPDKNTLLINHLCDHPMWFAASLSREEIRVNAAWMATDPTQMKWEVWNGGRLAGMLFLSKVVPPIDALFHFTFFGAQASGVSLFGAKKLLWNFIGFAFEEFNLRRISMEVPEHYPTLIRFARQKLGFRYESEGNDANFDKLKPRLRDEGPSIRAAVALHGSRKEGAHWNEKSEQWEDVILLRLLRSEYDTRRSSDMTTRDNSVTENRVNEPRIEVGAVLPTNT